jgi:hypothetical protein
MRRIGVLLVGFGLLAASGVAAGTPCCTLTHLAGPPSVASSDCCDSPDCCRVEERGPAQATLSAKAAETLARAAFIAAPPVLCPGAVGRTVAAFGELLVLKDHSPPLDRRATRLLISLFRV